MSQTVYWHDGMFFLPQHMQAEERFIFHKLAQGQKWNLHHNWGLRMLELDLDELRTCRVVIRNLQARLRDGTLIDLAETSPLATLDLKAILAKKPSTLIYLAVPELRLGKTNVADVASFSGTGQGTSAPIQPAEGENEEPELFRFSANSLEVEDENIPDNAQSVHIRSLNVKLMTEAESKAGYEMLPLARIKRADTPDALPELDRTFIPPILACDAWPALIADILQVVYDRIGKKIERLAAEVVTRNISFDTRHSGAARRINQLQILNEASAVLRNLSFVAGVHPFWPYVELCRIVGKLAIFGPNRTVPDLPNYDHDDLGGCYYRVKQYLEALLDEVAEPEYQVRPFIGEGLRMQVALEREWLQPVWQMFVGVRSPLDSSECVRMLTKANQLDMKIGSSTRVDEIFDRGEQGLRFTHTTQLPQTLPAEPGLIYFQVVRESQQQEWQNVEKSLTLAIRLNQNRIVGDIQGQRALNIQSGGQTTRMEFVLYLVPEQKTQ